MPEIKISKTGHSADQCQCENCVMRNLITSYVPEEDNDVLCRVRRQKSFKKGEIIVKQGDPIIDFFYIKSGIVKLSATTESQRTHIISIAKPHDYISLLTVFHGKQYAYTMTAIEYTEICIFPLNLIIDMAMRYGNLAIGLLKKSSKTSDDIIDRFVQNNSRNLRGRIAMTLLDFSKEIYKSRIFELPISRKEIAELIGMTTENVIRILSEFKKEEIIRIEGKEIEILDFERLQLISDRG
ncbi:MAG: Crp/Fnr family transcriptional regulator [Bacteroidales bacterium]|jgi:CRP/FNR family transcriptional regulator|nr:Crp/Fnr family transcriptional regulator [Bacteroidales bacterium]